MRFLKAFILFLGALLLGLLVGALFLKKTIVLEEQVRLPSQHRPLVFEHIADLAKWQAWSVWDEAYYAKLKPLVSYEKNAQGRAYYKTEILDQDTNSVSVLEVMAALPYEKVVVAHRLWIKTATNYGTSTFYFKPTAAKDQYQLEWRYEGDYSGSLAGLNPLKRYLLFFTKQAFSRLQKSGLEKLKQIGVGG